MAAPKRSDLDLGNTDDPDNIDAIANKLNDQHEQSGAGSLSDATLDMDALNAIGFNTAQEEIDRARMFPPRGDWEKDDHFTYRQNINEMDSMPGDTVLKYNKVPGVTPMTEGRLFYLFSGYPKARTVNGVEYKPMFFLRISPDKRASQNKPTEDDLPYKLFLRAKDLYLSLHGESATSHGKLITMLQEDNYLINIMVGSDRNIVILDVKDKPKRR